MIFYVVILSLFCLLLIAEDMLFFEINYAALAVVVASGVCLNVTLGQPVYEMAIGGVIWAGASAMVRVVRGDIALGRGDVWLLGGLGVLAGLTGAIVAVVILTVLLVVTDRGYRALRGRPSQTRRINLFPLAPAAGLTILCVEAFALVALDLNILNYVGFHVPPARSEPWATDWVARVGVPVVSALSVIAVILTFMDRCVASIQPTGAGTRQTENRSGGEDG